MRHFYLCQSYHKKKSVAFFMDHSVVMHW